ncbi:MAG: hypothetical protein DWQ06_10930 [Calditrichaeota bacterium]|nr:MAG: hypothetical protein DWQ06_10930 [Calditrichota bacterium]
MNSNLFQNFKEINWLKYTIELLVVILGVSIAFMLDNWKENKKNIELEKNFLSSFQNDLGKDNKDLENVISFEEKSLNELKNVIKKYAKGEEVSENELFSVFQSMLSFSFIKANNNTFEFVKNSGHLAIIKNYRLKESFVAYYQKQSEVKYLEKFQSDYVNSFFLPFLNKNFDILAQEIPNKEILNSMEMKNIITGLLVLKTQSLESTKKLELYNSELRKDLDNELKTRF